MTDRDRLPDRRLTVLRRAIVAVIVVSFGIAAILGIVVLLGGQMGETAGHVLATTAIVGSISVAVLCGAALIGRRVQLVGVIGVIVSVLTAALAIYVVWATPLEGEAWNSLLRTLWTGVAATSAFALGSLLLLLGDRRRSVVRIGLLVTLGLLVVLLALTVWLIWGHDLGEAFARGYGVVAILAALGAVVVPVLSLLLPDRRAAGLAPDLVERLTAEAARRGITVSELVAPLLERKDAPPAP